MSAGGELRELASVARDGRDEARGLAEQRGDDEQHDERNGGDADGEGDHRARQTRYAQALKAVDQPMGDEDDERRDGDGGDADGDDAEDLHESEEDDACADDGPDTQPVELPEIHLVLLRAQAARPLEGIEKETGGGGGIRTPETRRPNGFRDRRIAVQKYDIISYDQKKPLFFFISSTLLSFGIAWDFPIFCCFMVSASRVLGSMNVLSLCFGL